MASQSFGHTLDTDPLPWGGSTERWYNRNGRLGRRLCCERLGHLAFTRHRQGRRGGWLERGAAILDWRAPQPERGKHDSIYSGSIGMDVVWLGFGMSGFLRAIVLAAHENDSSGGREMRASSDATHESVAGWLRHSDECEGGVSQKSELLA